MARNWIQGEERFISLKLTNSNGDAIDVSTVEKVKACIPLENGHLYKMRLKITGNTHTTDIVDGLSAEDANDVEEGQPITGPGIPANTTVLYTPASAAPNAQPAGTIKLSAATLSTVTGAALVVGDAQESSPTTLGRFKFLYSEADLDSMKVGSNDFEVKAVKAGVTKYLQFKAEINLAARLCIDTEA